MMELGYTGKKGHRFNFSKGWYERFRVRKNLNRKKIKEGYLSDQNQVQ